MKLGPFIRGLFGPFESQLSEAYRSIYIDIDALVDQAVKWRPTALRILEVGCGEGAVTQRLIASYSNAEITAIDITPRVGRLFQGSRDRVRFIQCTVQDIAATEAEGYDLVVLSDVLHHVPDELRAGLLRAIGNLLAPGASFVFKDWQRSNTPIHWLSYASDRWLTGDRIDYMSRDEMRNRLIASFGEAALVAEANIRPWRNNIAFLIRT